MTEDKTNWLIEKYPKIFDENFYFEHSEGWFKIIDIGCSLIQAHLDAKVKYNKYKESKGENPDEEIHQVEILQSKEKFGGLRFYVSGGDEYCRGVIAMMEQMSYQTCEQCGECGQLRELSWLRTLCNKHFEETTKRKL